MSTKPTVGQLPTWDTSLANTIVLTAGHQTNGWANNETPTSGEANTLFAFLYLWCKYLSDGAFQGAITMDTSLTMAASTSMTVSGTGLYKRGSKVRKIPVCLGYSATGNASVQWSAAGTGQLISIPIELTEGERLLSVTARVSCAGAADQLQLKVLRATPTTFTTVQLGGNQSSTGHAGALEALTVSGLTETASSADFYNYFATVTALGFSSSSSMYGLEVTTDIP